jgi:hypothetical protein
VDGVEMNIAARILQGFRSLGGSSTVRKSVPRTKRISFADISETPDPALLPPIDWPDCDETRLTPEQLQWRRDGVVILRRFFPDDVLDPYIARREQLQVEAPEHFRGGWYSPTPYEHVPELRRVSLYPPLMKMMEHLIGEPMLLHLNLTGWASTERDWHQDDYLNPAHVNSWYAAVWIALDHIDPDAGPFEYLEGSHKWPLLRGNKVRACMTPEQADELEPVSKMLLWPKTSERFVVPAIQAEIAKRGTPVSQFLAEKGDVLIWHGRLMHRGSPPRSSTLLRRALIAHYSGVNHRPDMDKRATDENGAQYFLADIPLWNEPK